MAVATYHRDGSAVAVQIGPRDWFWRAYVEGREVAQGHATSRNAATQRARAAAINKSGLIGKNY